MKITYITGATCTGKTTYANGICNDEIIISLDALSKAIRFTFDDFKLYTTGKVSIRPTVNNDKFLNFVKTYIDYLSVDYPDRNIIIEGCHFTPNEFLSAFPNAQIIVLGITDKLLALYSLKSSNVKRIAFDKASRLTIISSLQIFLAYVVFPVLVAPVIYVIFIANPF